MSETIAAIVCAYNEARSLPACLFSLLAQTRPPDEIIVIDNASTDDTAAVARAVPGVRVISEPAKGLVVARETARRHARSGILAYTDADCRAPLQWIERVERRFARRGAAVWSPHRAISVLRLGSDRARARPRVRHGGRSADTPAGAPGARRSARSSTAATSPCAPARWRDIGGFDRTIEFHGEDTNLGRRLTAVRRHRRRGASAGSGRRRAGTGRWGSERCSVSMCATSGRRSCGIGRPTASIST